MKKTTTFVALLALGAMTQLSAEARTWDFTKWSDETVANLKAGENWSDIEKADGTAPTEMSKDNCFWQVKAADGISEDGYLMANGEVIKELEGLKYTNTTDRSFAIAVDYPDVPNAGFGPYEGGKYIWLGSSKKNYFVIPKVAPGAVIKMGVESHKKSDARGVMLFPVGQPTDTIKAPDGGLVAIPTTYQDLTWQVSDTLAVATDIQIYNTNGCHIYYITVEGEEEPAPETSFYAVGGFQDWNPAEPAEFTFADGVYTLVAENAASMKISTAKGDWDTFNASTIGSTADGTFGAGTYAYFAQVDHQYNMSYAATWTVTIDPSNGTITFATDTPAPSVADVYLRGGMNGWAAEDAWKFSTTDGNVYTLAGVTIESGVQFKIADANWGAINYGTSAAIQLGVPVVLDYSGANISLSETLTEGKIVFNLAEKTLLVDVDTAVEAIESAGEAEYFNLQGVRVAAPENGIYIQRCGNEVKKVVIRK